jgi:iron complex transport system substrate-binding protein
MRAPGCVQALVLQRVAWIRWVGRVAGVWRAGLLAASLVVACVLAGAPAAAADDRSAAPGGGVSIVDDSGRTVRLAAPAQRVVSLSPSLTEFVGAVGALDALVGTDRASNHPPPVRNLPSVGDHARLDVEALLALRPDLVLAWHRGTPSRDLEQLEAAGLVVARFDPKRLDDIPRTARRVARLLGRDGPGQSFESAWRQRREQLARAHADAAPIRVFFQVWPQPLLTVGGSHLIGEAITLCGGRNVFDRLEGLAPAVSVEAVVAARPQVILSPAESDAGLQPMRDPARPEFSIWRRFAALPAVEHGQLVALPGDLISRQGPRVLDGVVQLCDVLEQARREAKVRR